VVVHRFFDLHNGGARVSNVLNELDRVAPTSVSEDHFLFYFSGHGLKDGICLNDGIITPGGLYSRLENVRGSKAVIVDACYSGTFLKDIDGLPRDLPLRTLVVAASDSERKAYERNETQMGSVFGTFTAGFINLRCKSPIFRLELRCRRFATESQNHDKPRLLSRG